MPLRLGALHDALLHPGDPDLARSAAEELANYDNQLAEIRSDIKVIKWMIPFLIGLVLLILGKVW